jgi:hypothetical protein
MRSTNKEWLISSLPSRQRNNRIGGHKAIADTFLAICIDSQERSKSAAVVVSCPVKPARLVIAVGDYQAWALEFGEQLIKKDRDLTTWENEETRSAFSDHLVRVNAAGVQVGHRCREVLETT